MKIKRIIWQNRRDFKADFECEHCGNVITMIGYDDTNYHCNVIPKMKCKECGKISDENYRPLATKYPDWQTV